MSGKPRPEGERPREKVDDITLFSLVVIIALSSLNYELSFKSFFHIDFGYMQRMSQFNILHLNFESNHYLYYI